MPKLANKATLSILDKVLRKISGKGVLRARKEVSLLTPNDDIDNIVGIIKSLEDSGVLIGVNETVKHETKKEEGNFLGVALVKGVSEIRIMSVERGNNKISKSSPSLNE